MRETGGGQQPAVEPGDGGARALGAVELGLAEAGAGLGGARAGSGCRAGVGERVGVGGRTGDGARAEGCEQVGCGAWGGFSGRGLLGAETEELVAEMFGEVLGVSGLGGGDDFFALGGDSLIALRVVRRLRPEFGEDLSARVVFQASTVAGLAALLDERGLR
ncbi:phosphopantetheine-binding protein [Actinosynnema mirum]|uniref:phosphopantetheine-binding protein n=1 Tax=Actinosynnema mirum TaxID=40567 RepID=UPI00019AC46A|nr:phosphopantetheine-binding protein [Actinosynnema mirum]